MKLLFSLLLLITVSSQAQFPGSFSKPNSSRGIEYNGLMADRELYIPVIDTTFTPLRQGILVQRPQDTIEHNFIIYGWNGLQWLAISSGGSVVVDSSGSIIEQDPIFLSHVASSITAADTARWNERFRQNTTYNYTDGYFFDGDYSEANPLRINLDNFYERYQVDSAIAANKADTDSAIEQIQSSSGSGTVTSVALTMPGVIFNSTVPGSPVTTSGTLAPTLATQSAYRLFGTGSTASTPSWLASIDSNYIPALHSEAYYNTKYGSGSGGANSNIGLGYRWAVPNTNNIKTSFAGYGIIKDSTTNANGITDIIDSATLLNGYVSNVTLNTPSVIYTPVNFLVSGHTATGTLSLISQPANQFLASPAGGSGTPTFRSITSADLNVKQTHTTGTSVTLNNATTWLVVNPASVLSALSVTMPATPTDAQRIEISFGGTLSTGEVVTTLTLAANTGQAILESSTPTTVAAGETIAYRYNSSNLKWYRIN